MRRTRWAIEAAAGAAVLLLTILAGAAAIGHAASGGPEVQLGVTSSPSKVNGGRVVTYVITATSTSNSNMSHFTVTAPSAGSDNPFPLSYIDSSLPSSCTAPTSPNPSPPSQDGISCSLGALAAGATKSVSLAFRVPASQTSSVTFTASASYSGGSNNDSSGRTNIPPVAAVTNLGSDPDETDGFVISKNPDALATVEAPSGDQPGNPQSATATVQKNGAPGFGVAGTVKEIAHGSTDTSDCPAGVSPGASCWGQTEVVTFVDSSGTDVALLTPGTVVIRTDDTEIPIGVTKNNIVWYHTVNGVTEQLPVCVAGEPVPTNGCVKSVSKLKDGDLLSTIQAFHHGQYRP
jgi:Domain of unknown function DUF11